MQTIYTLLYCFFTYLKKTVLLLFMVLTSLTIKCQENISIIDTLYYFDIRSLENNCNYNYGGGLIKNLNEINIDRTNYKKFNNSFYSYFIFTHELYEGFITMFHSKYDINDKNESEKIRNFIQMENEMYSKQTVLDIILIDSTILTLYVYKIIGDFWIVNYKNSNNINQIKIDKDKYSFDYFYKFKEIKKTFHLNEEEIIILKEKFQPKEIHYGAETD